jgi:hypothetical protein
VDKAFKAVGATTKDGKLATAGALQQALPNVHVDPDTLRNSTGPEDAGIVAQTGGGSSIYIGPAWDRAQDHAGTLLGEGMHLKQFGNGDGAVSDAKYAEALKIPFTPDQNPKLNQIDNYNNAASKAFHGELEKHCPQPKSNK